MSRILVYLAVALGVTLADHHHGGHSSGEDHPTGDKPWIGKWESTSRQENFEAFLNELQVKMPHLGEEKVVHKLWKEGDHYHHRIAVPSQNYKNDVQFKLGEEGTANFNNTDFKYLYKEDAEGLKSTFTIPSKNKVIEDSYKITGDDLEKTYKVGDVSAKKWYKRVKASA